ncbi:MAG: TylF/MycF family methyltransferase [Pseudomonadota bacterium]
MIATPQQRYLDLLKKTLSFILWPEPPEPVMAFNYLRKPLRRTLYAILAQVLSKMGLILSVDRAYSATQRLEGEIWPGYADTMIGMNRLDNLQLCTEQVLADNVPGDFIETGVWRGGACIFMRAVLAAYGVTDRKVFVADSFQGLPRPDGDRFPADKNDTLYRHDYLAVSQDQVKDNFRKYDLLDEQVVFLAGWFEDTLPSAPISELAVLRLDGDMYSSTMQALESLYAKLSPGGFCIIDDYFLPGCQQAVDDYRARENIQEEVIPIDGSSVYWRKNLN